MPIPGTNGGVNAFFSPDGRKLAFTTIPELQLRTVGLGGEPPVTLADSIAPVGGSWGRDGYIYAYKAFSGLVRIRESGGRLEQLSTVNRDSAERDHGSPQVLPDGSGLLFLVLYRGDRPTEIAAFDLATRHRRTLFQGVWARYAPTGHLIYVTAEGTLLAAPFDPKRLEVTGPSVAMAEDIAVRGVGGVDVALSGNGTLLYVGGVAPTEPQQVVYVSREGVATPIDPNWAGEFESLALSPDGKQLAVASGPPFERHIWVKQLDRGPALKLTFEGNPNHRPAWHPDGRTVLFLSTRGKTRDLYSKPADGSMTETMILPGGPVLDEVVWSKDRNWLVLRSGSAGLSPDTATNRNIIAIRPGQDTARIPIVSTRFDERAPTLSPDGRFLAYISNESGRHEVYVRPFPDANRAKWQVSTEGATEPLWSPTGNELFYRTNRDMMVATVSTRPDFSVGERKTLFPVGLASGIIANGNHRAYDVMPDGQRFVMIQRKAAEGLELILVDNWFTELKARVPK